MVYSRKISFSIMNSNGRVAWSSLNYENAFKLFNNLLNRFPELIHNSRAIHYYLRIGDKKKSGFISGHDFINLCKPKTHFKIVYKSCILVTTNRSFVKYIHRIAELNNNLNELYLKNIVISDFEKNLLPELANG